MGGQLLVWLGHLLLPVGLPSVLAVVRAYLRDPDEPIVREHLLDLVRLSSVFAAVRAFRRDHDEPVERAFLREHVEPVVNDYFYIRDTC